ncbi:hypothetical protein B0H14DRAFT_3169612 [Mycena olivaceomarginata]|nr:hypothetical protein B0H14DRAFT_3169612 [Mycena olivaceomarginata]
MNPRHSISIPGALSHSQVLPRSVLRESIIMLKGSGISVPKAARSPRRNEVTIKSSNNLLNTSGSAASVASYPNSQDLDAREFGWLLMPAAAGKFRAGIQRASGVVTQLSLTHADGPIRVSQSFKVLWRCKAASSFLPDGIRFCIAANSNSNAPGMVPSIVGVVACTVSN